MRTLLRAGLLWPTLLMLPVLGILLGLGTWQMQRKAWKDDLIAKIHARTQAAPIPIAEAVARFRAGEDLEYARVVAEGRFLPGRERHYWAPSPAGTGWHIYAPLEMPSGGIVIVNRGRVADADRDPARRPEPTVERQRIVGLLRAPEKKTAFTPDNDAARNIWYWRDLAGMARSLLPDRQEPPLPFFLEAEAGGGNAPAPQGGVTRLDLPNTHLQYALTWYGLAATLIGVYSAFVWSRLRQTAAEAT